MVIEKSTIMNGRDESKRMKLLFIAVLTFLFLPLESLQGEPLTVLYFKRPPYYETIKGQPAGLLVELTRQIFEKAGITPVFKEVPPARIIREIKNPNKKVCSIGWFKNAQRETFAKFSLPFYQNQPLVVLTTWPQLHRFELHAGIKEIFSDPSLILARIDSFSYGTIMDQWIKIYSPSSHGISSKQSLLPRLIMNNRASYMLAAPEEIPGMLQASGLDPGLFVAISKPDIPPGNKRYIIFSKRVEDGLIERINRSITPLLTLEEE